AGLKVIHQEFGSREGIAAMSGRCHNENNVIARHEPPVSVNDGEAEQRPARLSLLYMASNLCLSHAGIVLERHASDRRPALGAPADSRESDDGADVRASARKQSGFRGRIEIRALQPYGRGHWIILPSSAGKTRLPWHPRSV